jgi:hypothetical protein
MKIPVQQFMEFLLQDLEVWYHRLVRLQDTISNHNIN